MSLRREVALVACAFLALAVVSTWPMPADPAHESVVDPDHSDPRLNFYIIFWGAHALLNDPLHLHHANIFHPEPYTYAYDDMQLANSLLMLPVIEAFYNPYLTYNLLVLISIVVGGTGFYVLARQLVDHRGAAFLGAAVFVFNPSHFARYKQIQLFTDFWLPWFLLCLLLWLRHVKAGAPGGSSIAREDREGEPVDEAATDGPDRSGVRGLLRGQGMAVGAAALYCLHATTGAHNAVFGVLLGGAMVLWQLGNERLWRSRRFWAGLLVMGLLASAVLVPVFYPFLLVEERMHGHRIAEVWDLDGTSLKLHSFLSGSSRLYRWIEATYRIPSSWFEHRTRPYLFPGLLPLVLGGLGIAVAGRVSPSVPARRRERRLWIVAFVVCLWLSLGPYFGLYLVVAELPGLRLIRVPSRFMLPGTFALGMLAAFGGAWIGRPISWSRRRWPGTVALCVVGVLFAGEALHAPLRTHHASPEPPPHYAWIADQEGDFAILEAPIAPQAYAISSRQVFHSIYHWKKLLVGYGGWQSESNLQMLRWLRQNFPSDESLDALQELGVRYVYVLERRMPSGRMAAVRRQERLVPVARFGWKQIYELVPEEGRTEIEIPRDSRTGAGDGEAPWEADP